MLNQIYEKIWKVYSKCNSKYIVNIWEIVVKKTNHHNLCF